MPRKYSRYIPLDERNRRIQVAIDARHNWIDSLADNMGHVIISSRWTIFADLVRHAGLGMTEFEQMLKKTNREEFDYVNKAKVA